MRGNTCNLFFWHLIFYRAFFYLLLACSECVDSSGEMMAFKFMYSIGRLFTHFFFIYVQVFFFCLCIKKNETNRLFFFSCVTYCCCPFFCLLITSDRRQRAVVCTLIAASMSS